MTKKSQERHGFYFYTETLPLKPDDAKQLKDILSDERSFKPFFGPKKCGGYHPDYSVVWPVGETVLEVQICFGCHEVKIYGPDQSLYCDIAGDTLSRLKDILKPYRKNRLTIDPTP